MAAEPVLKPLLQVYYTVLDKLANFGGCDMLTHPLDNVSCIVLVQIFVNFAKYQNGFLKYL